MEEIKVDCEVLAQIEFIKVKRELLNQENHIVTKNEKEMYIIGFCQGMKKYNSLLKDKYKVTKENNLESKK